MPTPTELLENAEARFKKKELQRIDGCAAMAEYEAASRATIAKTTRLRELRLLNAVAARPAPAKPKAARPTKPKATRPTKTRARRVASSA